MAKANWYIKATEGANVYRVWNIFTRVVDVIQAPSSFEARKTYAALYGCLLHDCAARRLWD